MIVATAGHIDHGKTALIRALTGVDTDRLPEEKRRGITVDLGFAYRKLDGHTTLSFVDVPGHERLVRTMLAGAIGVDFVLLVVAADDGVMPQTREHLAIVDLLGLERGAVAITKVDKVGAERVASVVAEVSALLEGTSLAGSPVQPLSALKGDGMAELQALLAEAAAAPRDAMLDGGFRLAVDRAFTLPGTGLVVTGAVHAGRVAVGDRLVLSRTGAGGERALEVRVRGLHASNEAADTGRRGQRCALNITGARVDKAAVSRGDWLHVPGLPERSARADCSLRLLGSETRALRHWTPVHVHIGSADLTGRIATLEDSALQPGARALAQLVLDQPTSLLAGDRFVIRDQSAQRTLGGGVVVDPFAPQRGARKQERLAVLRVLDGQDRGPDRGQDRTQADGQKDEQENGQAHGGGHAAILAGLTGLVQSGVDLERFAAARNIGPAYRERLVAESGGVSVNVGGRTLLFSRETWAGYRAEALEALEAFARLHPEKFGATSIEVARAAPAPRRAALVAALLQLVGEREVARFGQLFHLPGHSVALEPTEDERWRTIEATLVAAGTDPPRLAQVAERCAEGEAELVPLLEKLARIGHLRRVNRAYFVLPAVLARLAGAAERCALDHEEGLLTVGRFREETGIGRHATMPVLEFFDRAGFTSRHNEGRRIRTTARAIFGAGEDIGHEEPGSGSESTSRAGFG